MEALASKLSSSFIWRIESHITSVTFLQLLTIPIKCAVAAVDTFDAKTLALSISSQIGKYLILGSCCMDALIESGNPLMKVNLAILSRPFL